MDIYDYDFDNLEPEPEYKEDWEDIEDEYLETEEEQDINLIPLDRIFRD